MRNVEDEANATGRHRQLKCQAGGFKTPESLATRNCHHRDLPQRKNGWNLFPGNYRIKRRHNLCCVLSTDAYIREDTACVPYYSFMVYITTSVRIRKKYLVATREKRNAQLLVDHKTEDTHLGGTAVVQFDGALLQLLLLGEGVPSEVDVSVTEVAREFVAGSWNVLKEVLEETDRADQLEGSAVGHRRESSESVGDIGELSSIVGDKSGETNSRFLDEVTNDGKHRNTAVLELNISETIELCLITVSDQSKRVEKAERGLRSESVFERHVRSDRSSAGVLRRRKGSGASDKGGSNDELHG